jgi:proteasome lid subunit RPN8/RPN11
MLGRDSDDARQVCDVIEIRNTKDENRARRYLITPEDYKRAEELAAKEGLQILGLYHSHPDHPAQPSQFDLDHALPWWSYVIVSVEEGLPTSVRSWLLRDDRSAFDEETLAVLDGEFIHNCK